MRGLLWPLAGLSPRERAVFTEYHYWNTHMAVVLGGMTLYVTTAVLEVKMDSIKEEIREVKQQVNNIYHDIYRPSIPRP
jgi:CRISPR/Cas system-associated endonuclease Cas3-HD